MPESQEHGKLWEKDIGMNVYKASEQELKCIPYTSPFDIPRNINRIDSANISIKVTGTNSIDMADIIRLYNAVNNPDEPYHMTVLFWEQINTETKKLKKIIEINLTNTKTLLFGTATLEDILLLVNYVKSIPKNGRTKEHTTTYLLMANELSSRCGGFIRYAPKVDSKSQRRVQGRLPNFTQFVEKNSDLVIAESNNNTFRGGTVKYEIAACPRLRQKKPALD